ncbi:hypothetical protein RFI_39855, partial [Reticulomyxa filosa]
NDYNGGDANNAGQWLVDVTQHLWSSIPLTEALPHTGHLFFPQSTSFLVNCMQTQLLPQLSDDDHARLINQLLQSARQLELRHLGVQYLKMVDFIDKGEHFTDFKQGLLENEQCVRDIISSYSNNRNISDGEYPMFIRDLLAAIKRVESISKDTKQQHTYTALLRSLYNENKESVILQMQLLRDMCIHQCVNNDILSLQSKDAVLLNRCLEKILLEENANANNALITNWAQWCHEQSHDQLELVIRISQLKTDLSKLIWNLTNIDICMFEVEQENRAYNLIKQMSELLSS